MKNFYPILFFFFLTFTALSQSRIEPKDTTLRLLRTGDPSVLERPVFILPMTFALAVPEQNMQLPLYQSFAGTPQSFAWNRDAKIDLTAPLKLELYQSEAEKAFRITLGAAELGGVAYIAYKHIKKYGLK